MTLKDYIEYLKSEQLKLYVRSQQIAEVITELEKITEVG